METDNLNDVSFNDFIDSQLEFYNKIKNQNKHTGVRITDNNNTYKYDPFNGYTPFIQSQNNFIPNIEIDYNNINLNLENYSRNELFKLFNITSNILNDCDIKNAKKIVLKTHPDKSRLEPKYFIFYSKAYKQLQNIYEFQNKTINKKQDRTEYFDDNKFNILSSNIPNINNFNDWFNNQFDKYNINKSYGYDDWLKSDEGILNITEEKTDVKSFNIQFEKYKKQVLDIVSYKGLINNYNNSNINASSLIENNINYSSNNISTNTLGYTDIKEAFTQPIIPVSEENICNPKGNNIDEYIRIRENQELTPLNKEESINILLDINKQHEEESVTLAYYYAKEIEENNNKQEQFWSNLRQLTNK